MAVHLKNSLLNHLEFERKLFTAMNLCSAQEGQFVTMDVPMYWLFASVPVSIHANVPVFTHGYVVT